MSPVDRLHSRILSQLVDDIVHFASLCLLWAATTLTSSIDPCRAPALGYAFFVPVIVFVLGRIVTSVVNAGSEWVQRPLRVDCAAGSRI